MVTAGEMPKANLLTRIAIGRPAPTPKGLQRARSRLDVGPLDGQIFSVGPRFFEQARGAGRRPARARTLPA